MNSKIFLMDFALIMFYLCFLIFTLHDCCLYIMESNCVFYGVSVCANMCVSVYIFLVLFLWLFFMFVYFALFWIFCFYFIFIFCSFSYMFALRWKSIWKYVNWVGKENLGGIWRRKNYNQNMLYKGSYFQHKIKE